MKITPVTCEDGKEPKPYDMPLPTYPDTNDTSPSAGVEANTLAALTVMTFLLLLY